MGKKIDALLGRTFRASKFRPVINLAFSRLNILKNQRHVKCSQARSDVLQLIQLGNHQRALLRVEQVIKEQNLLDAYEMIEGYLNLLNERINLIEEQRECPDELKEGISGLIFAASRCGDFPELQEIKSVFTSRFGREFAARAVELRNNCGVSHLMMQKLSTRQPNLESKVSVLKAIASENGISFHMDEAPLPNEGKFEGNKKSQNQAEPEGKVVGENSIVKEDDDEASSGSTTKAKQKYKDVADAAQAAFESAAQAAAAARAAVELSRSEPHDDDPRDPTTPKQKQRALESGEQDSSVNPEMSEKTSFRLDLEKKPISVRTRKLRGY